MNLYNDLMRLVDQGFVVRKEDERGYQLFKYHRKVFYDNLWHLDEALLEARGIVFDAANNIVQRPLQKIFNLGENDTDIDNFTQYTYVRKVNGFMVAVSYHNSELVVSTTGSLKSDYVQLAKKYFDFGQLSGMSVHSDYTFIFEICDPSDPHIVAEDAGAYLLAIRHKETGELVNMRKLEKWGLMMGFNVPFFTQGSGDKIKLESKTCEHEGFVVYTEKRGRLIPELKIKSPHYLSKKALMRMGKATVNKMYDHPQMFLQRLDEEFYAVFRWILDNYSKDEWSVLTEQDRRQILEDYFNE